MKEGPVYQYVVVIRNEHSRFINIIGMLLSIGSAVLFLREMIAAGQVLPAQLIGVLFIAGMLVWNFIQSRRPDREIYYSKALLIAGLVWMKMPYFQWLCFVFIILAILEYQAKHPLEIGFRKESVVFNTLFKKHYSWTQISNVVLKDGLLTIDFHNNKLFQKEIDEGEMEAGEQEFNDWCGEQLNRHAAKA